LTEETREEFTKIDSRPAPFKKRRTMPSWHSLLEDVKVRGSVFDVVRREWLAKLAEYTGRNVIISTRVGFRSPAFMVFKLMTRTRMA
jgi:hypothetical protein